jgi:peptidoglycan/xylan/chitin deacetylase (PgdA/CDA1 family)
MYHVLAPAPPGTPFPQLWVPPGEFRAQVRALARAGYVGVTLGEVLAAWRHGAPLPRRPVVLSFDDGYSSDARVAGPDLARLHWPGVLDLAIRNAGPRGLRIGALRTLVRHGWEIDSHTVSHPDLTVVPPRRVRAELVRSKAWIRRTLGVRAPFFCYPAGRFDAAVVAAVRRAGYEGATTEIDGVAAPGDDAFELPRVRVTAATSPARLVAEL